MTKLNSLSPHPVTLTLGLFCFLAVSTPMAAENPAATSDGGNMALMLSIVLLVAVALSSAIIAGLVLWSRKLERMHDMMVFCIKHLVHAENETERCRAVPAT